MQDTDHRGNSEMKRDKQMELIVWHGDYGLVSMDCECIRIIMYAKFAQVPFELKYMKNPLYTTPRKYPIFRDNEFIFTKFENTVEHLRFNRYSLDFGLSTKCCSEMLALMAMVNKMLEPVLEYVIWIDHKNYEELTRPWYGKVMPAIFCVVYTVRRRKRAMHLINAHFNSEDNETTTETFIKKQASECFSILTTRLGDLNFFYGTTPSSLDCSVYAYLAPLIKIPFPSNDIQKNLLKWPKLVDYVKRIDEKYFPNSDPSPIFLRKVVKAKSDDVNASIKLKVFTFTFVALAVLGYAVSNKIISFPQYSNILRSS